jgi:hypothetical protein
MMNPHPDRMNYCCGVHRHAHGRRADPATPAFTTIDGVQSFDGCRIGRYLKSRVFTLI